MATVNSTETPVFSGWHMFATGACHGAEHEKISSSASVLNAISLIGKTVLVELVWEDDSETLWRCVRIAGVVLALRVSMNIRTSWCLACSEARLIQVRCSGRTFVRCGC